MTTRALRALVSGEEALAEAFLRKHPETTLFLRSNLSRAGLQDGGVPYRGAYVGAFEGGTLEGLAAHYWNGNVILAGGAAAGELARQAVRASGRSVKGLIGPYAEVADALVALDLAGAERFESKEILYALELDALVVPHPLATAQVVLRAPRADETDRLFAWRMAYVAEATNTPDTPENRAAQWQSLTLACAEARAFVLTAAGAPVAFTAFNAELPDIVQVGGVWTPPEHRSRGYARCAVAGALLARRDTGVGRAILFTGETNVAAQRAYTSLGFRVVGDYGIVLFGS